MYQTGGLQNFRVHESIGFPYLATSAVKEIPPAPIRVCKGFTASRCKIPNVYCGSLRVYGSQQG